MICITFSAHAENELEKNVASLNSKNPFDYDLNARYSIGSNNTVLLCSHGFGGNSKSIINRVRPYTDDTLVAFNYIDHDFSHSTGDDNNTVIATPMEIIPLLFMLKKCVVDYDISSISLYGYGLGASNIIYALKELTNDIESPLLNKYGIRLADKKAILNALKKGKILLDSPFKSIDENISLRGPNEVLLMYKERAKKFGILSPLETLANLKELNMYIFLFFDIHNEEFSNREDSNFARNLLIANSQGTNIVITADTGGHNANHEILWKIYRSF